MATKEEWAALAALSKEDQLALKNLADQGITKDQLQGMLQTGGGPAGNPGYSFAAPRYAKQSLDVKTGASTWTHPDTGEVLKDYQPGTPVSGGGITWMGAEGGDTPEARQQFLNWLRDNSVVDTSKMQLTGDQWLPPSQRGTSGNE